GHPCDQSGRDGSGHGRPKPSQPGVATNLVLSAQTNGANRTLTIIPTLNLPGRNLINGELKGTNLITMTVTDDKGNSSSEDFPLTVTFVDQPPTISTATNTVSTAENTPVTITYTIGDVDDLSAKIKTNVVV